MRSEQIGNLHHAYFVQNLANQQSVAHNSLLLPQQQQSKPYPNPLHFPVSILIIFYHN